MHNETLSSPLSRDYGRNATGERTVELQVRNEPSPHVLVSLFPGIRSKIVLSHLLLTIVLAFLGTYAAGRIFSTVVAERFASTLTDASQVNADTFTLQIESNLDALQAIASNADVSEALAADDGDALQPTLISLAASAGLDEVLVVNSEGQVLVSLQALTTPDGSREYLVTQGHNLSQWLPATASSSDASTSLGSTPSGAVVYSAIQVEGGDGTPVARFVVGSRVDTLLEHQKVSSQTDLTLYGSDGLPVASTFPGQPPTLTQSTLQPAPDVPQGDTRLDETTLFGIRYAIAYQRLATAGSDIGILATAVQPGPMVRAATGNQTAFVFALATGAAIVAFAVFLGIQLLALPVYRLARLSRAVSEGSLNHLSAIPDQDHIGTLTESFNILTDFLEERTVALQQEFARVNAILGSIADGVIVRDNQGEIILMNNEARSMLDQTPNFRQSPLASLGEDGADDQSLSPEEEQTPRTHRVELVDRVVSARTSPVLTENGEVIGEVLVMRDVTSEAAAERLKDDFINSISHELRTPLTVIKGYSDVLLLGAQKGVQPDAFEQKIGAIYSHAESLETMIRQLIDLSEMAAGTLHLDRRPMNLNDFLANILDEWHSALRQAGQTPLLNTQGVSVTIDADERRLRWAIDAVLQNASQYSPDGGTLEVTLSTLGLAAVIQINDEGVGISGQDLPHVFERFYRGKPISPDGTVLDPRGVGQGLYVVKSVVEAHGGRVWIDSELGRGTKLSVLLPLPE